MDSLCESAVLEGAMMCLVSELELVRAVCLYCLYLRLAVPTLGLDSKACNVRDFPSHVLHLPLISAPRPAALGLKSYTRVQLHNFASGVSP